MKYVRSRKCDQRNVCDGVSDVRCVLGWWELNWELTSNYVLYHLVTLVKVYSGLSRWHSVHLTIYLVVVHLFVWMIIWLVNLLSNRLHSSDSINIRKDITSNSQMSLLMFWASLIFSDFCRSPRLMLDQYL